MTRGAVTYPSCASWGRRIGVEPAGTAPQFDVLLLVEHPLPWPRDVAVDPLLSELSRVAAQQLEPRTTVRLQVAALGPAQTERRVVVFDRGEGPFAGYRRREGSAPVEDLPGLVEDLIRTGAKPSSTLDVTDVLVCTHGARDRCCGSMGTRLWQAVEGGLDTVRVWRTSHTGGHRFAPTAITFPDGACWAYLDETLLRSVIDRSLSPLEAWSWLRGCTAFRPTVQAADGAVLASAVGSGCRTPDRVGSAKLIALSSSSRPRTRRVEGTTSS